jgi:transcriptional repressor NrdR
MRCPFCGAIDTRVVDSRLVGDSDQVRRRRECNDCEERFSTYETAELNLPRVVKSRGNREPFSDAKLQAGFQKALEKRPVSVEAIDEAVARIRHRCLVAGDREIDALQIGEWVMDELKELDQVAYIRFASVYRRFDDAAAFREAIDTLESQPAVGAHNQLSLLDAEDAPMPGLPVVSAERASVGRGKSGKARAGGRGAGVAGATGPGGLGKASQSSKPAKPSKLPASSAKRRTPKGGESH